MQWGRLDVAGSREWLVTDGRGGYASGTVSDVLTRRYHGLLVAALQPPLGRRVLFTKLDAGVTYGGDAYDLGANRWHDGTVAPQGYRCIEGFRLDGRIPVWTYAFEDARLEKRVWMDGGATTFVTYTLIAASQPLSLAAKGYIEDRDFHTLSHAYDIGGAAVTVDGERALCRLGDGTSWHLAIDGGALQATGEWYYGMRYDEEAARGLDCIGDVYHGFTIDASLAPGASLTIGASLDPIERVDAAASLERVRERERALVRDWKAAQPVAKAAPDWIAGLVLAADQFVVERTGGATVIAGYHWFGDWGRDTMIALPGLALATGRAPIARSILATFARYVDRGMIPNRFPDEGETPEYNTVDASLWFVEAVRLYHEATADDAFVAQLFDALDGIVDWYVRGTRYGIAVDPSDGLVRAGEPGVQLTWMDAKVGEWVVTPRIGKAVEINALWYNALRAMDGFAGALGRDPSRYRELAGNARRSFARFWNPDASYLYDVLDGPDGNDASIRPNAVFAAALPFRAIDQQQERAIVAHASRSLLTAFGLRSLDPQDPAYVGRYGGPVRDRDAAYHRGTVWPYLIGPFVRAWTNATGDAAAAARFIEPFAARMRTYGMGTLAEIADGDAPFEARGAIAQAWSVGEVLRTWHELQRSNA